MEKYPAEALPMIQAVYESLSSRVSDARARVGKPLTYAEKILFSHLSDSSGDLPVRGETTVGLAPDRVAMQDATAQMAILQFMTAGRSEVAVPTTVHCDHLVRAKVGAFVPLRTSRWRRTPIMRSMSFLHLLPINTVWDSGSRAQALFTR
jgi:aconitate hydratase